MNIAEPICRHARTQPDRVALIDATTGRQLTFKELDGRSSALAAALADAHQPGDRVAVLAKNCIEYFEIYLACAKSGCIAHGLNWRFAQPALIEALRDSAPGVVIVQDEFAAAAAAVKRELEIPAWLEFGPDSDGSYEDFVSGRAGSSVLPATGADDPLMIMYTGGTTGDSKGALHSHATVSSAMANNSIAERIVPTDRYLLLGQAFHSAAVLALNYLRHGCSVVVLDFQPEAALEVIDTYGVSCFLGFPTMLTYMLEHGTSGRFSLASLRNIQYGGGAFSESTILGMLEAFPCTLIQCYGTTESIGVTFLSQEDHERARAGERSLLRSCGVPAFLTDVRLVADEGNEFDGQPVGEIHVRSASNMLGYWDQWRTHGAEAQREWLPTGDLAYMDDAGYFYVVGRSKDVIISGGENIYAPQVENVLFKHPAVLEAAVIGVPDEVWGEAVSAVVVLRSGKSATEEEIREWVRAELGSYQKPKTVRFVDALPKTPTGKVLKRALQES